jgi:hypothetical protein
MKQITFARRRAAMLKTNQDILEFINKQTGRTVEDNELKAYIGENADQRLREMRSAGMIRCETHWYDERRPTYTIDAKGDALLAEKEKERQRNADDKAAQERQRMEAKTEAARNRRNVVLSAILGAIVGAVVTFLLQRLSQ